MKYDYKGKEPDEIFIALNEEAFRVYISEGQALRWVTKSLAQNKKAKLVKYVKTAYEN